MYQGIARKAKRTEEKGKLVIGGEKGNERETVNRYAILMNPGHNRVYFEASKKLSVSELSLTLRKLSCRYFDVRQENIKNISYLVFNTENPLKKEDFILISRLSFLYAFFERVNLGKIEYLLPILLPSVQYMDNTISAILKYTGKTNELFTRMLIQLGLLSSTFKEERIKILDPVAGKGTTLYEAMIYGYDAYGIEINEKSVVESYHYIKKYLEREKYKHTTFTGKITLPDKNKKAKRYSVDLARNKEEWKSKETKHWEMIEGNSIYADQYFKKNTFHLIIGDLPYGIQHGSAVTQKPKSLTRNPSELLSSALTAWYQILKKDGILVLSWNSFVLKREALIELLDQSRFSIFQEEDYLQLEHRVDQAIKRDIIIAKK